MSCNCGITCPCGIPCSCPQSPCGCTDCRNSPKRLCLMCGKTISTLSSGNACTCFQVASQQPEQTETQQQQQGSSTVNSSSASQCEKGSSIKVKKNSKLRLKNFSVGKNKDCMFEVGSKQLEQTSAPQQKQGSSTGSSSSASQCENWFSTKVKKGFKRPLEIHGVDKNKNCIQTGQTSAPQQNQGSSTVNSSSSSQCENWFSTIVKKSAKRPLENHGVDKNKDCIQTEQTNVPQQKQGSVNSENWFSTIVKKNLKDPLKENHNAEKNENCTLKVDSKQPDETTDPPQSSTMSSSTSLSKSETDVKLEMNSCHRIEGEPVAEKNEDCVVYNAEEMTAPETNARTNLDFVPHSHLWTSTPGVLYSRYCYQVCERCKKMFSFKCIMPYPTSCIQCSEYPENNPFPCTPPTSPLSYNENGFGYNSQFINHYCDATLPQVFSYGVGLNMNDLGLMNQMEDKNDLVNEWLNNVNISPYKN